MNLASRLQAKAPHDTILMDQSTQELVEAHIDAEPFGSFQPKGFSRPRDLYKVLDFKSGKRQAETRRWNRRRDHVEVTVTDSSDIAKAIMELRDIEREFEEQLARQQKGEQET